MARTTTIRRAPASTTSSTLPRSMPPIANHGRRRDLPVPRSAADRLGGVTHQVEADGGPSGLGGSRPHGSHAEVVESLAARARKRWRRPPASGLWVDRPITVSLPRKPRAASREMSFCPTWNTGAPDREAMSARSLTAHSRPWRCAAACRTSRSSSSSACLERLVAQLDDVHPAGERGVHEVREVAAVPAGVGAQVEAGSGVEGVLAHETSLVPLNWAHTAGARSGHVDAARLRGRQSRPLDLIRLVPA